MGKVEDAGKISRSYKEKMSTDVIAWPVITQKITELMAWKAATLKSRMECCSQTCIYGISPPLFDEHKSRNIKLYHKTLKKFKYLYKNLISGDN